MGEKNGGTDGEKKTSGEQNSKKNDSVATAAVLNMDLHCNGCISKLKKLLGGYKGVEYVKAELESNKLTLTGRVDPVEVQKFLEHKTKKKVELVSPAPKKDGGKDIEGVAVHGAEKKRHDDKKLEELQETTAVMKMNLHCEGCIEKVYKYVTKTKGYQEIKIDREKELVTVKGTMDMNSLVEFLKEKLKIAVVILHPKKDNNNIKTESKGFDGGGREGITTTTTTEQNKIQYHPPMGYYGYPPVASPGGSPATAVGGGQQTAWGYPNPPGFVFSDDNPNACSLM